MIKAIVGLGNPGRKYENTRHNLGFRVIKKLFKSYDFPRIALLTPIEGMNNSGVSVKEWCNLYKVKPEEILVILDCFALPFGDIRYKSRGSSAGHKGLQSIINALGSENIPRIRMGIGEKPVGMSTVDFVLGEFTKEENKVVEQMIAKIYYFFIKFTEPKKEALGVHGLEIIQPHQLTDGTVTHILNFKNEDF